MFDLRFRYNEKLWEVHLSWLPKIGEQLSVITDKNDQLGKFWFGGYKQVNGHYDVFLTRLGPVNGGMSVIVQKAPESP